MVRLVFTVFDVGAQLVLLEGFRAVFMGALLLSEIVEQLAYVDILGAGGCPFVEVTSLNFHCSRLVADGLQTQRAHQPDGLAADETSYVLTAEERDVVAEFFAVE